MKAELHRAIHNKDQDVDQSGKSDVGHTHVEADVTDLDHDAVKLQGVAVENHAPLDAEVLTYVSANSQWEPAAAAGGSGGIPWYITLVAPPTTGWSWDNQNGATISDLTASSRGLRLYNTTQTTPEEISVRYRTAPATPYTFSVGWLMDGWFTSKHQAGICFRESASGKIVTFAQSIVAGNPNLMHGKWTTSTSFSTNYRAIDWEQPHPLIWMRGEDDGTNLKWYLSTTGGEWTLLNSTSWQKLRGDFFTTGPDQIGFFIYPDNTESNEAGMYVIHWATA
jgi:hypothetical protein